MTNPDPMIPDLLEVARRHVNDDVTAAAIGLAYECAQRPVEREGKEILAALAELARHLLDVAEGQELDLCPAVRMNIEALLVLNYGFSIDDPNTDLVDASAAVVERARNANYVVVKQ
jgi:hypothetical protein